MSDNGDSYLAPWWWIATWVIWGTMMALITYVIEGVIVSSLLWFLAGCIYAIWFFPVTRPLIPPVMDWFYRMEEMPEEHRARLREIVLSGMGTSDVALSMLKNLQGARIPLIAPFIAAGTHGIMFGSLTGVALACLPNSATSTAAGGVIGVLLGLPTVAIVSAIIFAAMMPKQNHIAQRTHPRLLMLLSPLFVVPIALHCVKWYLGSERRRAR